MKTAARISVTCSRDCLVAIESGVDVRGTLSGRCSTILSGRRLYQAVLESTYVDYATQVRILKRSGLWYKAFVSALPVAYGPSKGSDVGEPKGYGRGARTPVGHRHRHG